MRNVGYMLHYVCQMKIRMDHRFFLVSCYFVIELCAIIKIVLVHLQSVIIPRPILYACFVKSAYGKNFSLFTVQGL